MFENPRRGRQARNFGNNVPKILDLKSSSEQIFSENCRWVPLTFTTENENSPMCVNYVTIHTQIYGERGFPLTATPLTLLDPDNPYLPQI